MDDITLYANLNADEVKAKAEELQSDIEDIFNQSGGSTSPELNKILAKLAQLYAKAESVKGRMADLENQTFTTDEFVRVSKEIDNLTSKVTRLQSEESKLAEKQSQLDVKIPTDEYKAVQDQLIASQKEYDKLIEKRDKFISTGGNVKTKSFKQLQYDIDQLSNTIQYAKGELKDLEENEQAFKANPEYETVSNQLSDIREQISGVLTERDKLYQQKLDMEVTGQDTFSGVDTAEYQNLSDSLGDINNKMFMLKQVAIEVGQAMVQSFAESHPILFQTIRTFGQLASSIAKVAVNLVKLGISGTISGFKKLASAVKTVVTHLVKLAGSGIINGIKRLSSAMGGLNKQTARSNSTFQKGFKTFIKYAFGVRSVYFLVRKLRTALIEGFGDLAKVSEPFNVAVSEMRTALRLLRNSFAAAFSPIIQVVSPIITRFITQMAEAVNKVGQMIAALTGQKTYMRAIAVYQDYAESLDKSSKSADKASKSTKKLKNESEKLKKTLAGFDDVEILKGPDDDNDDSDLDLSGLEDAMEDLEEPQWEEVAIGERFKNLSDLLKRAWENADFTEVGKIVGEKLKNALANIPWDGIKEVLRKVGKSIATFLNGFLEVPELFTEIGKTLAEGLNSAFEFAYAFISNFHWDSLGKAIKDLILGALNTIDWPLIYKTLIGLGAGLGEALQEGFNNPEVWTAIFTTISKALNSLVYGIGSFLRAINWGELGANIGTGLNAGIEAFDWGALTQTLIDLINGAFDLWYNFITTVDFYRFGAHIGTALGDAINGINWGEGGAAVGETLMALFNTLNGAMDAINWADVGKKIIDAIKGFFSALDWESIGAFFNNIVTSLFDLLSGAFEEIKWDELPDQIMTAIKEFFKGFDYAKIAESAARLLGNAFKAVIAVGGWLWNKMKAFGKNIIDGGWEGIKEKMSKVGEWIKKHVFEPFMSAFKSKENFDVNSPSEKMKPIGKYIIAGLFEGITSKLEKINSWIKTNVFNPVKSGINNAFGIASGVASTIKSAGSAVVSGFKNGISNNWHSVTNWVSTNAPGLKSIFEEQDWTSIGTNICSGISNGLSDGWDWLTTSAWNLATSVYNSACNALDIGSPSKLFRNEVGKMIPAGMALGILDNEGLVENAMGTLTETVANTGQQALKIPAVVKGSVVPYQATITSQTESALQDVVNALETNYTEQVTPDVLHDMLVEVISTYLDINFYLGDEQIARHANAGNARLSRRFNKLELGGV